MIAWLRVGTCFRAWVASSLELGVHKNLCEFPKNKAWVSWSSSAMSWNRLTVSRSCGNPMEIPWKSHGNPNLMEMSGGNFILVPWWSKVRPVDYGAGGVKGPDAVHRPPGRTWETDPWSGTLRDWGPSCVMLWGTYYWLVVWLPFFIFPYIGLLIIPIDFHIFQRGGPTTNQVGLVGEAWGIRSWWGWWFSPHGETPPSRANHTPCLMPRQGWHFLLRIVVSCQLPSTKMYKSWNYCKIEASNMR